MKEHRVFSILVIISYYLLVVLPHEWIGHLTVKVFGGLSRQNYNLLIATCSTVLIVITGGLLIKEIRQSPHRKMFVAFLIYLSFLVFLCFAVLFVINIEVVHIPQYALFAILFFPLSGNFRVCLIATIIAGSFDELYQYLVLAPEKSNYFDFNDVIIDMVGGMIGITILAINGIGSKKRYIGKWALSTILWVAIFVVIILAFATGLIEFYTTPDSNAWFGLIKEPAEGFWHYPPGPPAKFHILRPLEGVIILIILWKSFKPILTFNAVDTMHNLS